MGSLKQFFLGILSLFLMVVSAQKATMEITWSTDLQLQWADFKGRVPINSRAAATTASGISYSYQASMKHHEVEVTYEVQSFFYPHDSWYKPSEADEVVLAHERLHFDITELFARRMRDELKKTSFSKNVKKEIGEIYRKTLADLEDFQNQYDLETDYSRNYEKQQEWQQKVAELLGVE